MRILFCGDLVGRSGRDVVVEKLPALRRDLDLDLVVANGENAAGGFGITQKICDDLYKAGVDCITTGNHVWDQKETLSFIGSDPRLLRPINFPAGTPGKGSGIYQTARGKKVMVANIMARLFMDPLDDPFQAAEQLLLGGGEVGVGQVESGGDRQVLGGQQLQPARGGGQLGGQPGQGPGRMVVQLAGRHPDRERQAPAQPGDLPDPRAG